MSTSRGTVVSNCESLGLVNANAVAGTPTNLVFSLGAQSGSMPWLQTVGTLYQKYRVRELTVTYEPICPTTIGGQIVFALVYDQNDTDVANVTQERLLQVYGNARSPLWTMGAAVCYDKGKAAVPWYASKFAPNASTQANLVVPAWLIVSTVSSTASIGLGRLMAHYTYEFIEPTSGLMNA